jgi:KaiC/GvpD/RAD55 family RecA-like ATPase
MYTVGETIPVGELDAGTFLLSGPAMSGKYQLLVDLVVEGFEHGDASLFVTTNEGAGYVVEDIQTGLGRHPEGLGLVDCASEPQGVGNEPPIDRVKYVSSPADLTGIGIGVSELMGSFGDAGVDRVRIAFYSLSTLLMYAEVETVFRFMHVLSGRVESIDGLGFFAVDPTAHDESVINTLKQVFDGMIELRDGESGREIRFVGIPGTPGDWIPRV